ncbi:MAG: class I SAM-dependent methyltransferase [candidate division KSB1 bacterium]|nr:class I SAM-dependent methyltransferase [candidate division KSB1 bacterium]MDQ7065423.1 class I SAM-dependent methyltransferase [candidate division KSB1 bacterium]
MARNRSLAEVNYKISKTYDLLQRTLTGLLEQKSAARVLEVGFGEGRALLEFAWQFRSQPVSFFGVDKKREPPVLCRSDLAKMALEFGICPPDELAQLRLPDIDFYDATELRFPDEHFDLIYSAVTVRFIPDKARFLEEVCRVLRLGGVAYLHIGQKNWDYPYSRALPQKHLTPYNSRFVLKYGDELIPLPAYLQLFEEDRFRFEFVNRPRFVLKVEKHRPGRLDLQLQWNDAYSMSMKALPYRHKSGKIQGGFRSVYDLPEAQYRRLIERGLIRPEALRKDSPLESSLN